MKAILGTMTFGQQVNPKASYQMISQFLGAGFKDIDTAYVYNNGKSEEYIGHSIATFHDSNYLISTKVNPRVAEKFDFFAIKSQLNTSLERLGLQKVNVLYLHFPDPRTPLEITLEACAELHREGKYSKLGLSNFPAWQIVDAWNICDKKGWPLPEIYQGLYNGLSRNVESELLPVLREHKIGFYAYNPLAGGILAGKYRNMNQDPREGRFKYRPNYRNRYWKSSFFEAVEIISSACKLGNITVLQAAYSWLIHHSRLSTESGDGIVIGASSLNQLKENLKMMNLGPLPSNVLDAFDNAWLRTRTESPNYYRTSI